jgi:hypothetical protein
MTETDCGTSKSAVSVLVPVAASAPTKSTIRTDGDRVLRCAESESEIDRLVWVGAGEGQVTRELREAGRRNAHLIVAGKQIEREGSTRGGDDGFLLIAAQEDDAGGGDRSTGGIGNGSLQNVGVTRRVATGHPRLGGRRGGGYGRLRSRTNAVDNGKQRQGQSKSHARKDLAKGSGGLRKPAAHSISKYLRPQMRKLYTRSESQARGLVDLEPFAVLRQKSAARGFPDKCFKTVLKYDKMVLVQAGLLGNSDRPASHSPASHSPAFHSRIDPFQLAAAGCAKSLRHLPNASSNLCKP